MLAHTRKPETPADLVAEPGDNARAGTSEDAAGSGDIVVVTIPFRSCAPVDADAEREVVDLLDELGFDADGLCEALAPG